MTIAQIDAGANRERDIGRDVNRNISRRSFQLGLVGRGIGFHELHDNAARPVSTAPRELRRVRSHLHRCEPQRALWRGEVNAATARLNLRRAANVPEVDVAAAGFRFYSAGALTNLNGSATVSMLAPCVAETISMLPPPVSANDLSIAMMHHNGSATGVQADIAVDGSHVDGSAARLGVRAAAISIKPHTAATALRLYASGYCAGIDVAALGFDFTRDVSRGTLTVNSGELTRPSALPVANDPGRISAHVGVQL